MLLPADDSRAYYLAVTLKPPPELPEPKLLALLPKITRDLLETGTLNGLADPIANREQLKQISNEGEALGGDVSYREFRVTVSSILQRILDSIDIQFDKRQDYQARLYRYYSADSDNEIAKEEYTFDYSPGEVSRFLTGFAPLDNVLSSKDKETKIRKGITPGIITFLADAGVGKTYITQAIASQHDGPVLFYENENGKHEIYERQKTMLTIRPKDKRYIFGDYDVEEAYHRLKENPDPDMLVVFDSLQSVFGNGQGGNDYINYQNGYKYATKMYMEGLCKYVIMSSHVKANNDGMTVNSAGASAIITKKTTQQITITLGDSLPDDYTILGFKVTKNRGGKTGKSTTFAFHHITGTVGDIFTGEL